MSLSNTSNASIEFEIEVSTTNSDLDDIPDFCDSDDDNDGLEDVTFKQKPNKVMEYLQMEMV